MGSPVQVSHCSQSPLTPDLMMINFLLLVTLLTFATASPVEVESTETKASSPLINCGRQCSSLTFRDANGVVQGNCLTVDSTGAQWCYVDQAYSSCQDLVPSKRFPNNPWSYEACATPAQGSPLCPVIPVYPVPSDSYHHHHDHHHHDHHDQLPIAVIYSPEQIGEPRETQEEVAVATKDQVNFNTEVNLPSK